MPTLYTVAIYVHRLVDFWKPHLIPHYYYYLLLLAKFSDFVRNGYDEDSETVSELARHTALKR